MVPVTAPRPAVFLDRDGTLIREREYLSDPGGVELIGGVTEALRRLRAAGYLLVVVTNQSGIGRGLYSVEDYRRVAARLDALLAESEIVLDGTWFCPHHPDHTGPCDCRKPGLGMYRAAIGELSIDPGHSYFIGDKVSDLEPASRLGGQAILVRTGYGTQVDGELPEGAWVARDLLDAARIIPGLDARS